MEAGSAKSVDEWKLGKTWCKAVKKNHRFQPCMVPSQTRLAAHRGKYNRENLGTKQEAPVEILHIKSESRLLLR